MSTHSVQLEAAMAMIDTVEFASAVDEELCDKFRESGLDEEFCRNAGSIGGVEIGSVTLDLYTAQDEEVTGSFHISFHESYYNGCRDLKWRLPWEGSGSFTIHRATGEMEIEIEAERLPEDDDDEE